MKAWHFFKTKIIKIIFNAFWNHKKTKLFYDHKNSYYHVILKNTPILRANVELILL